MKRYISSQFKMSQCSFDFKWSDTYYENEIEDAVIEELSKLGYDVNCVFFYSLDYSGYGDSQVSQGSFDFEWSVTYNHKMIESAIRKALSGLGYELLGVSFCSVTKGYN